MHPSTYRSLAIAQSMSGLHDKARASVAELLKLTPSYTVSQFRAVSGFAMGPLGDVFTQAFRSAGLPE
jgi:hypothetical protein